MTLYPGIGTSAPAAPLEVLSRDLFELDFSEVEWSVGVGQQQLVAASGHVGTFARGATLASISDALGATYTAVDGQMGLEQRDWDNDGVRESLCLRMGTSDRLPFAPTAWRFSKAIHFLVEFVETGARTTAGATLFALRKDDGSGSGFYIDTSGSFYRCNYTSGATTRTATIASGAPVSGDRVQLYGEIDDTGILTFYQTINGAAPTSANAAALALPGALAADAAYRVNSRGTSVNPAQAAYRRLRVRNGPLVLTELLERR